MNLPSKVLAVFLIALVGTSDPAIAQSRPNLIVILSDDMGFTDTQPYGSEIQTPSLQRMADEGLRYSNFYVTPRCSPTRASLLTGQYSHAVGMGHLATGKKINQQPGYARDLRTDNNLTMGEALHSAGYRTQVIGKWHVTKHITAKTPEADRYNWPTQRGFDDFYGIIAGAARYFDPATLVRNKTPISPFSESEQAIYPKAHYDVEDYVAAQQEVATNPKATPSANKYNLTDAISDNVVININEHFSNPATQSQPLFQYIAYTTAHWPLHATPEDIAKYDETYGDGYQAIREQRFAAAKAKGVVPANTTLPPPASDWEALCPAVKAIEKQAMQAYAAQIDQMDQGIGRILDALEGQGQLDNTLVIYLQDNGGNHEGGTTPNHPPGNIPQRPSGPTGPTLSDEQLQRQTYGNGTTRDGYPMRRHFGVQAGAPDTYQYYSRQWGNVSNTPYTEYKSDTGEGGIASPLIVRWGDGIDADLRGQVVDDPAHAIDILATLVEVGGVDYSAAGSSKIDSLDGVSLMPNFSDNELDRGDALYWEHEGWRAIRDGEWKALTRGPGGAWELYNLDSDRSEATNVASEHPEVVQQLASRWEAWAIENDVMDEAGVWPWKPNHAIGRPVDVAAEAQP